MNLVALQTFLAIVRTGSLVRASTAMNVTQSTVTSRLQTLEAELGQTLVLRQKNGATLTAAGIKLRRYAEAMTQLWLQAKQETSLPPGIDAICNIGVHADLWAGYGTLFFESLRRTRPSIALSVWQGDDGHITQWLANGLVDVAFTFAPPPGQAGQMLHTLSADRLCLVGTEPDRPIRHDPGYIYVEAGPDFEREHTAAYADADTAKISFNNASWALAHLRQHGGSAYLPHRLVAPEIDGRSLFALDGAPDFQRPCFMVVRDSTNAYADDITAFLNGLE
jgi:DNA-binding transcriptional LysR family regulator